MCNKINIKLYLAIDRNEFCAPRVLFRIVSIAARPLVRFTRPCVLLLMDVPKIDAKLF